MNVGKTIYYEFGKFRLEPTERLLIREDRPIPLPPRTFDTLVALVEKSGHLVDKDHLLERVWHGSFVEEVNLTVHISALRKALGTLDDGSGFIETVPKRGYRFTAPVKEFEGTNEIEVARRFRLSAVNEDVELDDEGEGGLARTENIRSSLVPETPIAVPRFWNYASRHAFKLSLIVVVGLAVAAFVIFRGKLNSSETSASSIRSVAVLPLKNLSGDASDEYFSSGVTESLTNSLSKIDGLRVISPSASKHFTNLQDDPVGAGKQLGVAAVLEGSVRKDGESVRLSVRLLSTDDGRVVWASDTNDRALKDVFALQDEIALGLAEKLRIKLSAENGTDVSRRPTQNTDAYQLYLKGRYYWNKRTQEGLTKGIEYFQQAIKADPNYALAYAGIADCYAMLYSYDMMPAEIAVPKAKEAALKAIEIDDQLAEPHCSLAYVESDHDWNWQEAESEYKTAIALDPNYATAHHWYALTLANQGRFDESLREIRLAQQLDPLSLPINANMGRILFYSRQYEQARSQLNATLDLDENFWGAHYKLAELNEATGRDKEAIQEFARSLELQGDTELAEVLDKANEESGSTAAMRKWLEKTTERSQKQHVTPILFAELDAALGKTPQSLSWLEKAADERCPWIVLINANPNFDKLRGEPRFKALLKRLGLTDNPGQTL